MKIMVQPAEGQPAAKMMSMASTRAGTVWPSTGPSQEWRPRLAWAILVWHWPLGFGRRILVECRFRLSPSALQPSGCFLG
jgi:hypothetical protein